MTQDPTTAKTAARAIAVVLTFVPTLSLRQDADAWTGLTTYADAWRSNIS